MEWKTKIRLFGAILFIPLASTAGSLFVTLVLAVFAAVYGVLAVEGIMRQLTGKKEEE